MIALFVPFALGAEPETTEVEFVRRPVVGHPLLDLRVGVLRTDATPHAYVCGQLTPLAWLSVEGCGTGSGVLHQGDEPDMAHFRARARVFSRELERWDGALLVGAGFAEVQSGRDQAGFVFGETSSETPVEAAGPEVALAAEARYWLDPRAYVALDGTAGVADIAGAPAVLGQGGRLVPFAALTVGVGF